MSNGALSVEEQIAQLDKARQLVQADSSFYPQIVQGILPIAQKPQKELRIWCSQFLADAFSSPQNQMSATQRQDLALLCLEPIQKMFQDTDPAILKSLIECSASIFPLVFKHICDHREDKNIWDTMCGIKSRIFQLWDSEYEGIKICCIKFVQRVVAVQSPGAKDPRLANSSDVSLTLAPLNHPLLPLSVLEAEAIGLLDRLTGVLTDKPLFSPTVTAVINCLGVLIRTRSTTASKILSAVLSFHPSTMEFRGNDDKEALMQIRFVEKSLKIMLTNGLKANRTGPYGQRVQQYIAQLTQSRQREYSRKRSATSLLEDRGPAPKKAKNVEAATAAKFPGAPPVSANNTIAQLFTLIPASDPLASFDITALPPEIATNIALAGIQYAGTDRLKAAIAAVLQRFEAGESSTATAAAAAATAAAVENKTPIPTTVDQLEDDDDYDPSESFSYTEATTKSQDQTPPRDVKAEQLEEDDDEDFEPSLDLPSSISQPVQAQVPLISKKTTTETKEPSSLTTSQRLNLFQQLVERIFASGDDAASNRDALSSLKAVSTKLGSDRLAAVDWEEGTWVILLSRLCCRGLSVEPPGQDETQGKKEISKPLNLEMARLIRNKLLAYVLESFRSRISVAVSWLNEEWYSEVVVKSHGKAHNVSSLGLWVKDIQKPEYFQWTLRLLDGMIPFLDMSDWKLFLRLLSDLPELSPEIINRLKPICLDPDRAQLGFRALKFLVIFRPPIQSACLDLLQDLYSNYADAKGASGPILKKFRPTVVSSGES